MGGLFVHFSTVPRMIVYPRNKYHTPTGFYAYPLISGGTEKFAAERPYAVVFRPKKTAVILDLESYSEMSLAQDIATLMRLNVISRRAHLSTIQRWTDESRSKYPGGVIWNITRMAAKGKVAKWTMILHKALGYDGVVDNCTSTIHGAEPCQAVFFNTAELDLVDIVDMTVRTQEFTSNSSAEHFLFYKRKNQRDVHASVLDGQEFCFASLYGADMSYRSLRNTDFSNADLRKSSLDGSDLTEAALYDAKMNGATLRGATLRGATLRGANLTQAVLIDADMPMASFHWANMKDADLRGSDVRGVDFRWANLTGIDATGATFDADTMFPEAFDPVANGMVPVYAP